MLRWAELLGTIGECVGFDYPYMHAGRRRPDRLPILVEAHRRALKEARRSHNGPPILIGKSMGGRVGCHLALEEPVAAVVCLGYPLCGGGDPNKMRDEVLLNLRHPVLFVQGTRDALCPLRSLAGVQRRMAAKNHLVVVDGADHSLLVTKRQLKASGQTQEEVERRITEEIRTFVSLSVSKVRMKTPRARRQPIRGSRRAAGS